MLQIKRKQTHIFYVLESKGIEHSRVNIADPRQDELKKFMNTNTPAEDGKKILPPQIFHDDEHVAVSQRLIFEDFCVFIYPHIAILI